VNLSSLNGFLAQPSLAPYCAAKFGVRGFTEALRAELLAAGQPVRVTVVHPGGVRTGIAAAALRQARAAGADVPAAQEARVRVYEEKLLRMPPGRAATLILDGVARNRPRVLVGRDARAADLLVRLLPGRYPRLVAWWDRRTFGRR
jgi:short-subunit dehydrogenase